MVRIERVVVAVLLWSHLVLLRLHCTCGQRQLTLVEHNGRLLQLSQKGLEVLRETVNASHAQAYLSASEARGLAELGYRLHTSQHHAPSRRRLLREMPLPPTPELLSKYLDNSELQQYLHEFVNKCSGIAKLTSIGKSVLGTDLWVLEISDEPGVEAAEPSFKWVANMHGDEPSGRQLLLHLAEWLCSSYKTDPDASHIVHNMRTFILPTINPDGFAKRTRYNANGVDLNRDFPDQFLGPKAVEDCQPETRTVMQWSLTQHCTAGASLHEGALVANYPWDGSSDKGTHYAACPDDAAYRALALAYSRAHPIMHVSKEFKDGITNGAAWYPLYGGMQDWNYLVAGCMELTIEVDDHKWPQPSVLPQIRNEHHPAMVATMKWVAKAGVRGKVQVLVDAGDGLSQLTAAQGFNVTVSGIDHMVVVHHARGYYHRLLAPGTYNVTIAVDGAVSQTREVVVQKEQGAVVDYVLRSVDLALDAQVSVQPVPIIEVMSRNSNQYPDLGAIVKDSLTVPSDKAESNSATIQARIQSGKGVLFKGHGVRTSAIFSPDVLHRIALATGIIVVSAVMLLYVTRCARRPRRLLRSRLR
eukprot:jgi/Chlat1/4037/Chrsp26S04096